MHNEEGTKPIRYSDFVIPWWVISGSFVIGHSDCPCGAVGAHHSVKMEARVQFPSRALLDGTVRQMEERPSSNLGECGFDSHPCYLRMRRMALGRRAVCKTAAFARQVRFLPDALTFGPLVYRQDIGFSTRKAGFNSPTDCSGRVISH